MTTKLVNGKRVQMTAEEEAAFEASRESLVLPEPKCNLDAELTEAEKQTLINMVRSKA